MAGGGVARGAGLINAVSREHRRLPDFKRYLKAMIDLRACHSAQACEQVQAAANVFRLRLAIDQAIKGGGTLPAIARLRLGVVCELSAALAILGLVAWLGTLEPPMSM
jgi:hypothetical protein